MNNSSLSSRGWQLWLPLGGFALLWLDLIRQLSYTWETSDQYAYGWFVPMLALGLFLRKWPDRPGSVIGTQNSDVCSLAVDRSRWPVFLLVLVAAASLLPLRVIHEINQDWPLISWPLTAVVVALTLCALYLKGGWRWVKYFGFPVCFVLVAVRWPYRIENSLTQGLMQFVAGLTVETLGWLDVPALQRGNLIEIGTGVLGVDEACSGIRSLQSTLMASLFLGELYRLRWPIRLLLVGSGLLVAFGLNVARALILTWEANRNGIAAVDKWHDPAGFTIAVVCFVLLWLIAFFIKRKSPTQLTSAPSTTRAQAMGVGRVMVPREVLTNSSTPRVSGSIDLPPDVAWRRFTLAVGLWSILCIGASDVWYRLRSPGSHNIAKWSVSFPVQNSSFKELTLTAKEIAALKCDVRQGGSWTESEGTRWSAWFFRWTDQSLISLLAARCHRPEICLPASGRKMQVDRGLRWYRVGELDMPFRTYTFDNVGRSLHVFFCLWQDGTEQFPTTDHLGVSGRLWAAARGMRMLGQQSLEIMIDGASSFEAAEQAVREKLPGLIQHGKLAENPRISN